VELLNRTGAEGVMLGRASRGRPDIPGTSYSLFRSGRFDRMGAAKLEETIRDHAELECIMLGEERGMRRLRKHLHWYFRAGGLRHDAGEVDTVSTMAGLRALLEKVLRH